MKKSCVAACPVEWPDGRGISGRMRVEWVAGSPWNRWSDAHGMGGQMTVESAAILNLPEVPGVVIDFLAGLYIEAEVYIDVHIPAYRPLL